MNPKSIRIGKRNVGDGHPVFVIAEAGSNHNGSLDQAMRLIEVAAGAGADAVKFQTFTAEKMYPRSAGASAYLKTDESIYSIIERMQMPRDWIPTLASRCRELGIEFLSTPTDETAADSIADHVGAFKIASYELTHTPLIRHVAKFRKPVILSTGAADMDEVVKAVAFIREAGVDDIIVCQCTAKYPAPPETIHVRAVAALREATGCLAGLSDHSRDPVIAPLLAVGGGACLIEKHFTLDNNLPGPDHRFAVEPEELCLMIRNIRTAEQMMGSGRKKLLTEEEELHAFARRSLFATRNIRAGERFTAECVAVLRRGNLGRGLPPEMYDHVLTRHATRNIHAEKPIQTEDID